jgi:coronin-1B/1C/6
LSAEIKLIDIDQAAGVIMPFYDDDSQLLYLAGKGDGNIRYYEFVDETPWCFYINEFRSTAAAKGMAMVPKRGLDLMKCETARLLKLTTNSIEPLSFVVPRKSDAFQDDLFPPTFAGVPSLTVSQWNSGMDKPPTLMDLRPGAKPPTTSSLPIKSNHPVAVPSRVNPTESVERKETDMELEAALARILLLEKVIKDNGLRVP